MKNKRLLALIIAVAMVASLFGGFSVHADSAPIEFQAVRDGDTLKINVTATQSIDFGLFCLADQTTYDDSVFSYKKIESSVLEVNDGLYPYVDMGSDPIVTVESGTVFLTIVYDINTDAFETGKTYTFGVNVEDVYDYTYSPLDFGNQTYSVTYMEEAEPAGDPISFTIRRDGDTIVIDVTANQSIDFGLFCLADQTTYDDSVFSYKKIESSVLEVNDGVYPYVDMGSEPIVTVEPGTIFLSIVYDINTDAFETGKTYTFGVNVEDVYDYTYSPLDFGNQTYTLTYSEEAPAGYQITWKVEGQDDVVTNVNAGETPAYPNGTPAKEAEGDVCSYEFAGWATEAGGEVITIPAATENATYYAVFTPVDHVWGDPAYSWEKVDNAWKCTATRECQNDPTHVETETVTAVRTEDNDKAIYTATFTNEAFETQTKSVDIAYYLIGTMSNWSVDDTYKFTANPSAEGEYILSTTLAVNDEIKVVRAEGGEEILTWYPGGNNYTVDYNHSGSVNVYFRPAGNYWNDFHEGGFFYISRLHTVTVITDGNGTAEVDPTYPDVTATVTLIYSANEGYHFDRAEFYKKTGEGENDLVAVDITLGEGNTFTMPEYDVVIKVYFEAHIWGDPTYSWENIDGAWYCTATRECTECDAVETESVLATGVVTTQPGCETMGTTTYTAVFDNEAFTTQTKEVQDVEAIGHDWDAPTYEWFQEGNVWKCTATRVCKNDNTHVETETVTATGVVTVDPGCDTMGSTTYTAEFTNEAFETQTKVVEDVPAAGHVWGDPTYEWFQEDGVWKCTATRICTVNDQHIETETVTASYAVVTEPSAGQPGVGRYTAEFENEAFETQTKDEEIPYEPTAPTVAAVGAEIREREAGDTKKDLRFIFEVTFNDSYVIHKNKTYGPTTDYYKITNISLDVAYSTGESTTTNANTIYSMDKTAWTYRFTIVMKNIPEDKSDVVFTFTPHLTYEMDGVTGEATCDPLAACVNDVLND